MDAATEGLTPSNSSQLCGDLDRLLQEVQSAAQALLGEQENLKARLGSLGGAVPREVFRLAAGFSKAAAALLKATEQLTTAWTSMSK